MLDPSGKVVSILRVPAYDPSLNLSGNGILNPSVSAKYFRALSRLCTINVALMPNPEPSNARLPVFSSWFEVHDETTIKKINAMMDKMKVLVIPYLSRILGYP